MTIPEDQLTTWANIGAQATSKDTYATVKLALESGNYGGHNCVPFLQGSYGNDTNIRVESDVDIVMALGTNFYYDLSVLTVNQKAAAQREFGVADYNFKRFREDVLEVLSDRFGNDVSPGSKAITIKARNARRKTDVLVAYPHRKYLRFPVVSDADYVMGITFFKDNGTQIVNYPKLHSMGLISKNQETSEWFKHLVRIFKNARQSLIEDNTLSVGIAPSYYIEGLLHNVPRTYFGTNYTKSVFGCLDYLSKADRSTFRCPNGQYPLLDGNPEVTWTATNCTAFLNATINLWNNW